MATPESTERRIQYRYAFYFPDGARKIFRITLRHATLAIVSPERNAYPEWTALEYRRCRNCPLDPSLQPHCPIAREMVDAVCFLKDWRSFEEVEVHVQAGESRRYMKRTTLQEGAGALLGIYMVASGCPILNKLRPMLATHLPFMSSEESTYRTVSMYLMAQYFRHKRGHAADWGLGELLALLHECRTANSDYCDRLRSLGIGDAALNALALLNVQGELTSLSLETGDLTRWERIFGEHYD
ncbi:MAG: hypothetical protein JXO72_07260 [Vicinamibacteria bacterium]|nr:hypothetical protein [Vicinamibacteria bacterium]